METFLIGVIIFLILVIIGIGVALVLALIGLIMTNVPFLSSPQSAEKLLLEICALKEGDVLYDIGSGNGTIVYAMAKRYPHAHCVGIEMAPLPQLLTWIRTRIDPLPNVSFIGKDARQVPLHEATHVYTYLLPNMMEKLYPKLVAELRLGTKLFSCDFTFKQKSPASITQTKDHKLYLYEF
jgi:hypothetical protein